MVNSGLQVLHRVSTSDQTKIPNYRNRAEMVNRQYIPRIQRARTRKAGTGPGMYTDGMVNDANWTYPTPL